MERREPERKSFNPSDIPTLYYRLPWGTRMLVHEDKSARERKSIGQLIFDLSKNKFDRSLIDHHRPWSWFTVTDYKGMIHFPNSSGGADCQTGQPNAWVRFSLTEIHDSDRQKAPILQLQMDRRRQNFLLTGTAPYFQRWQSAGSLRKTLGHEQMESILDDLVQGRLVTLPHNPYTFQAVSGLDGDIEFRVREEKTFVHVGDAFRIADLTLWMNGSPSPSNRKVLLDVKTERSQHQYRLSSDAPFIFPLTPDPSHNTIELQTFAAGVWAVRDALKNHQALSLADRPRSIDVISDKAGLIWFPVPMSPPRAVLTPFRSEPVTLNSSCWMTAIRMQGRSSLFSIANGARPLESTTSFKPMSLPFSYE